MYFLFNVLGPEKLKGKVNDHYTPWAAFFDPHREPPRARTSLPWNSVAV
jgi:hypothetical protein